jgi:hypothetical protein
MYRKQIYYILFLILCSTYFIFNLHGYFRTNWGNIVYTEQTHLVQPFTGQYLYLDEMKHNQIKELRPLINSQDYVVINSVELWGYAYLLDATPITYDWTFNEEKTIQAIEENVKNIHSIKCICFKDSPFDAEFLTNLQQKIGADTIVKHELSSMIVYSVF